MSQSEPTFDSLPGVLREGVERHWARFCEREPAGGAGWSAEVVSSLPRVWACSGFVAEQCARRPALLAELLVERRLLRSMQDGQFRALIAAEIATVSDEAGLMAALRRLRNREMVRIAWRDIAGWADLAETLRDLSELAECCVAVTLDWLFAAACAARATPVSQQGVAQSMIVLGMGKLGAGELNYSSDIDLIFAYRDDGVLADKRETSYGEFYTRLSRALVKVLDSVTEDGFVFRVDTRLRPFGDSGPLVMSFDALEAYYQAQAREWERYAMVKARAIAGDLTGGKELEEFLRPFVYRRYLDYRALGELRELKRKITLELRRQDRQENVKLGPGGIREIEFIVQAFQLIRGGREKRLRERRLRVALAALGELGLMQANTVATLDSAYVFLRIVENRIQQYADAQTHDLPADEQSRMALAFGLGFAAWAEFKAHLDKVRADVHAIFAQVVTGQQNEEETQVSLTADHPQRLAELSALGWREPAEAAARLDAFLAAPAVRRLSTRGAAELQRLLPRVLRMVAGSEAPDAALDRVLTILAAVASRNVYFTLLAENPGVLEQLIKLVGTSAWICGYIAQHPLLLDELLDPRSLYRPLSRDELREELQRRLTSVDPDDQEQVMIVLRQFKQTQVLRVAAADLSGAIPIMVVSDYLTYIAEVLVAEVLRHSWQLTAERHGVPAGGGDSTSSGFAVIAYGKMGGLELSYSSDLDLVFLYDGEDAGATTGAKPVTTAEFFGRVAKRMIHLLTANTPAGSLYEVDLRLRPSGNSGLLVSRVDAFETYQMQTAWTWEQQALVKARGVAGDPALIARFVAIRHASLCRPRDRDALRAEVAEMRAKMRASLAGSTAGVFHLKHDVGGIVDIEFLVQFGLLSGAHERPALTQWTDVVRQLDTLAEAGFLSADNADLLRRAYCLYREHTHRLALHEQPPEVADSLYPDLRAQVTALWTAILGT